LSPLSPFPFSHTKVFVDRASPSHSADNLSISPERPLRHVDSWGLNSVSRIFEKHLCMKYSPHEVVTWVDSTIQSWKKFHSMQREENLYIFCVYSGKAHKKEGTLLEGSFKTARDVRLFVLSLLTRSEIKRRDFLLVKPKRGLPPQKSCFDQEILFMKVFRGVPGILQLEESFSYTSKQGSIRDCLIFEKYPCNLKQVIAKKDLNATALRNIQRELLQALIRIHEKGFIHRDIKPDNILLDPTKNWSPVFADFGLSTSLSEKNFSSGGTIHYMAPEVAYTLYLKELYDQGDPEVSLQRVFHVFQETTTASMDVFSLGVVFLEMLNGLKFPFGNTLKERASMYPFSGIHPKIELQVNIMYRLTDENSWLVKMLIVVSSHDPYNRTLAYNSCLCI